MDKLKLRKSNLRWKQFDGTVIKVMGNFKITFETKKHFEMTPITRVSSNKDHGLVGIDVLERDTTKPINSIKAEGNNKGLFRSY